MVAVLAAAVGIPVALVGRRADQTPVAARPELQRVLVEQRGDLDPEGLQDRRWPGRHETSR
jgi:hypothetical protein